MVVRAGLLIGTQLDRATARVVARERRRDEALRVAGRLLRSRDLSVAALDERLARRSISATARTEVLETLERAGFVDDARFAESRTQALAGRGWSDSAIRADLQRHRVDDELVAQALEALEPEAERGRAIVERRGATAATARFLAARGFLPETVSELLEAALCPESAADGPIADGA